jgi:hypothetical protein
MLWTVGTPLCWGDPLLFAILLIALQKSNQQHLICKTVCLGFLLFAGVFCLFLFCLFLHFA